MALRGSERTSPGGDGSWTHASPDASISLSIMLAAEGVIDKWSAVAAKEPRDDSKLKKRICLIRS